jgi:hypothetical protein
VETRRDAARRVADLLAEVPAFAGMTGADLPAFAGITGAGSKRSLYQ